MKTQTFVIAWICLIVALTPAHADRRLLGLCVGVDRFGFAGGLTTYAAADAVALSQELTRQSQFEEGLYAETEISHLTDNDATRQKIIATLRQFAVKAGPDDTVIFFFAGLAGKMPDSRAFYFKTFGAGGDDDAIRENALTWAETGSELAKIADKKARVVAMIDTGGTGTTDARGVMAAYESLGRNGKVRILASCAAHEQSYEKSLFSHGVYTNFVLQCLQSKKLNRNWAVTLKDLCSYLNNKAGIWTQDKQHPMIPFGANSDATENLFQIYPRPTNFIAPVCAIITPRQDDTASGDRLKIEICISDDSEVAKPNLKVNGVPYRDEKGPIEVVITKGREKESREPIPLPEGHIRQSIFRITVPLAPNAAEIEIQADVADADGNTAYDEVKVEHKNVSTLQGTLYLLAVGVKTYRDSLYNLKFSDRDANSFAALMAAQQNLQFARVDKTILVNHDATNTAIVAKLNKIAEKAKAGDLIMVMFSGHGLESENQFYFGAYGLDSDEIAKTCVSGEQVFDILAASKANKLIIMDACHSGSNAKWVAKKSATPGSGTVLMASCAGKQDAYESEQLRHGYFTAALLDGLNGKADFNLDCTVTIEELAAYIHTRTRDLPGLQVPKILAEGVGQMSLTRVAFSD